MLLIRRFDPAPCGFPSPKLRPLPAWRSGLPKHLPRRADATVRTFVRGRYALTWACSEQAVGPQGALAVPAYHCLTMIDGALTLGARIVLYEVDAELRPSLASMERILSDEDLSVRSVLVPHYFGAPVELGPIVDLCSRYRVSLIEDCSHVMILGPGPVLPGGVPFGIVGDHAVASPYKFSPAPVGGIGWSKRGIPVHLRRAAAPHWRTVAASMRQRLERALRADTTDLDLRLDEVLSATARAPREWVEQATSPSAHYNAESADAPADAWSQCLWNVLAPAEVAARRIEHYRRLEEGLRQVPYARPFWQTLPHQCVPYMFPLWLDHPGFHFPLLKRLGVPVWRWDEMAVTECAFAEAARTHLLHLPCHQSLRDDEMAWMIEALRLVLRRAPLDSTARSAN